MGLRYRKSIKIAPGIHLNIGSKSAGISIGGRGCRYSVNTSGRRTTTVGIPGTGVSYSTSTSSKKKSTSPSRLSAAEDRRQEHSGQEQNSSQQQNQSIAAQQEAYINKICSVHRECGEEILWENISVSAPPFDKASMGPQENAASLALENFKPAFMEKIFANKGEQRKQKLRDSIADARREDLEAYQNWEESTAFSKQILSGDIDAYYEVIGQSNPFEDLVDWGSGFEFGTDDPAQLEIEFLVKSSSVIPLNSKTLTKTGKLSEKAFTKTAYYDMMQDYVCSCSIRLARELFAILPVDTVIVHAADTILNTATGNDAEETILSVKFIRSGFQNIDFSRIDASDFTVSFEHHMHFKKTAGFGPVTRIDY